MQPRIKMAVVLLAGFGLGAIAMGTLRAQVTPPAYVISEIDVTNPDAYRTEYLPLARKALRDSGQKMLAAGGKTILLSGEPAPKSRVVVSVFESLDKARAAYTSPEYVEARKIGDQYAKLRIFAVEGIAPQ